MLEEEERKRKGHNQQSGKQTKERPSADRNAQGTTKQKLPLFTLVTAATPPQRNEEGKVFLHACGPGIEALPHTALLCHGRRSHTS